MSSDMRACKVFVSVFGDAVEKRQAYAWLVEHSRAVRYTLSQSLKDMKTVPEVYFKQTDIAAAVDVMSTIDRLSTEHKGEGSEHDLDDEIGGFIGGLDFDYEEDDFR
mmetsp:Transcript_80841/g.157964  ORF Transcript_80841/g.157964 Transcript_80841/m.157964 type:complete len:107 (-) Transcript_80841:305-625(-)